MKMEIEFRTYLNQMVNWLVTSGPRIAVILVLMFVGVRLSRVAAARIFALLGRRKMDEEYRKRADTLSAVVAYAMGALVIVVASLMILAELNIHIAPILAAAGVVGVAVGFGAQTLVQDVIGGFFILLEDEIRVGDVVETKPIKQWDIGRAFNRRLKQKFDERNIDAPFAHGLSSPGQDKAGPERANAAGGRP